MNIFTNSLLPPLYKLDGKGNIREWRIAAGENENQYILSYGIMGKPLRERIVHLKGGNASQRIYENWRKQLDEDYTANLNGLLGKFILPMSSRVYNSNKPNILFPVMVHREYDGIRCIAHEKDISSEEGEPFYNLKHIVRWTKKVDPVVFLDGVLISKVLSKSDILKTIKNKNSDIATSSIKFVVWDAYIDDIPEATYEYRKRMVSNIINSFRKDMGCRCLIDVPTYLAEFSEVVEGYHKHFNQEGYKGTIIRNIFSLYRINQESIDFLLYSYNKKRKPKGRKSKKEVAKAKEIQKNKKDKRKIDEKNLKSSLPSPIYEKVQYTDSFAHENKKRNFKSQEIKLDKSSGKEALESLKKSKRSRRKQNKGEITLPFIDIN